VVKILSDLMERAMYQEAFEIIKKKITLIKLVSWSLEEKKDEKNLLIFFMTLAFQLNIKAGDFKLAEEIDRDLREHFFNTCHISILRAQLMYYMKKDLGQMQTFMKEIVSMEKENPGGIQ
jgi:hypothetical protein